MNHQTDLFTDLPRGEQLAALRKLKLQTYVHNGKKVSAAIQKATLRAIDDHQGRGDCFASQTTLADEVGCGKTAIGLAIAALIAQDLITADRPHRMAPNRHRVVFSSVFQLLRNPPSGERDPTTGPRNPTTGPRNPHSGDQTPAQRVSSDPPSVSLSPAQRVQNAPETQIESPPSIGAVVAVDESMKSLIAEIGRWGMTSAATTIPAAIDRGLTIEHIRELWIATGGNGEPEPWQPGALANVLSGRNPLPFNSDEAAERIRRRESGQRFEADRIRSEIIAAGKARHASADVTAAVLVKSLGKAGLAAYATDAEREAAERANRRRQRGGGVSRIGAALAAVN